MPKGGYRPGSGRPLGARNFLNRQLEQAIRETGEDDLLIASSAVFDDQKQEWRIRLAAAQVAFGVLLGRRKYEHLQTNTQ